MAVHVVSAIRSLSQLQHLTQRRDQVLRVPGGRAVRRLRDQHAVAGVRIRRGRTVMRRAGEPTERVIGIGRRAVVEQVTGRVIAPADHLIRRVIGALLHQRPVHPHRGAVAEEGVAIATPHPC